jgi:GH15 family glucan-1,4-alpha-glucosidase
VIFEDRRIMKSGKSPDGSSQVPSAIEDYAMIGNCKTAALVAKNGSIDWLCLPRFDSPACFAALLGTPENGRWQLRPQQLARVRRCYRPDTLTLETEFRTRSGSAVLIDFMPMGSSFPRIIRVLRCKRGSIRMRMDLVIRFDYGFTVPWVYRGPDDALLAVSGPNRLVLRSSVPLRGEKLHTVADFTLTRGQSAHFELQYGESSGRIARGSNPAQSLQRTDRAWRKWICLCKYRGPWNGALRRSLLTLKALTYAPNAGIVAAPTTSLPEKPGGGWNWDYRYCWLRDATFTLLGLMHAGFHAEARGWRDWLLRCAAGSPDQLQIMYGVTGERLLREWTVPWLPGYRSAAPVRVGNEASEQLQLDVYGELADVLYQGAVPGRRDGLDFDLLVSLIEHLRRIWREPDHGIWELRGKRKQYTHSKVMAWVAFDRAIRSAERSGTKAPVAEWRAMRADVHRQVCRLGFNSRLGSFVQSYGSKRVDASLLLLPLVGFLPPLDPRIKGTVRRIENELLQDGFVMRFKTARRGDASQAREGAFLPCSFWLADYYELAGRHAEADRILKRVMKVANDVGLFSEEYDPVHRRLLGNFPQALTHVATVNTVINVHARRGPVHQRSEHEAGRTYQGPRPAWGL